LPELKDLPSDIYKLFNPDEDHTVNEDNLETFCSNLKDALRSRLGKQQPSTRPIRFSGLGRPLRQVWYDAHPLEGSKEELRPQTYVKFLYGAILEEMVVFLAREAGHEVTDCQKGVEVEGVTGSIDCLIDGVVVDVKSASPFGYKKFENRTVTEDDPFGYVAQLSGYADVLTPGKDAAWVAIDKVGGDICVSPLPYTVMKHHPPLERINQLKEVINEEVPPERCYSDQEQGKSGNRKLATGCSYCAHKFRCWDGLRGFAYSNGPTYLTVVKDEPRVPEIV
jgi:hypothetical protein